MFGLLLVCLDVFGFGFSVVVWLVCLPVVLYFRCCVFGFDCYLGGFACCDICLLGRLVFILLIDYCEGLLCVRSFGFLLRFLLRLGVMWWFVAVIVVGLV